MEFSPLRWISGWLCFLRIAWKNRLEAARMTLWASIWLPSSQARITSAKSGIFLRFPNALFTLSRKAKLFWHCQKLKDRNWLVYLKLWPKLYLCICAFVFVYLDIPTRLIFRLISLIKYLKGHKSQRTLCDDPESFESMMDTPTDLRTDSPGLRLETVVIKKVYLGWCSVREWSGEEGSGGQLGTASCLPRQTHHHSWAIAWLDFKLFGDRYFLDFKNSMFNISTSNMPSWVTYIH